MFKDHSELFVEVLDDSLNDSTETAPYTGRNYTIQFSQYNDTVHAKVSDVIDEEINEFTAIFESTFSTN